MLVRLKHTSLTNIGVNYWPDKFYNVERWRIVPLEWYIVIIIHIYLALLTFLQKIIYQSSHKKFKNVSKIATKASSVAASNPGVS